MYFNTAGIFFKNEKMEKLQKNILILVVLLIQTTFILSQSGTVRGQLIDDGNGMTIPFANILIHETGSGVSTDLDGMYSVDLTPGVYTFEVSYIGYAALNISEITVTEGQVTILDLRLKEEGALLEEVVVSAKAIRNTETALMTIQKKSPNLLDGISSQQFKRVGDSNAAAAIQRVPGVSVQGGKYVFVRGLGDRYTKSILNGMDIPGLDPDRNTVQMDIFPTNIIDNIIVVKSFTPDLPADFTGGVVNIVTKDFPEEKQMNLSLGTSCNPSMHLNNNYLSYKGSKTDWLGFDNGLRDLPFDKSNKIPAPINQFKLTYLTASFNNIMAAEKTKSPVDYNVSFSAGNQVKKGKATFGYNTAFSYKNTTQFFEDVTYNTFIKPESSEVFELRQDRSSTGSLGKSNVLLSGLVGGAVKYKNHKFNLNFLHIQNGKSSAGEFVRQSFIRNSNTLIRDNLEYTQSSISNVLLTGKHSFEGPQLEVEWKLSPTVSSIYDKDVRVTAFRLKDDGTLRIEPSEGAQPRRLFRNLDETNYNGRLDITKKFQISGRESKLKLGLNVTQKERDYEIISYFLDVINQSKLELNGDPNALFDTKNIWTRQNGYGTYITGNEEPANTYNAKQTVASAYIMNELPITEKLKAVYGLRLEKFDHIYTGQNNQGTVIYNEEKIIDVLDVLPALNLIYGLNSDMNLRASFSQTLARPSFKEASIAQIYDAISDRTFIGNINLVETKIKNFDVRWELFKPGGQMFSVSGFYKAFSNPIEIVAFSQSAPDNLQPRNVGDAQVVGLELEARKNLNFLNESLKNFSLGFNVTVVKSEVEMDKTEGGEYESRINNARIGEVLSDKRDMQGQAPYILNSYLSYRSESGFDANLSYNVQGESLSIVGIGLNPDVYTSPFHSLNFKASKRFGDDDIFNINIGVKNILGSDQTKIYKSFESSNQIFENFIPARTFSLGLSWRL